MICEAVQGNRLGRVGEILDDVAHFQADLASSGGGAGDLVVRSDIVDEGIVQRLTEFMGERKDVRKDGRIAEDEIGDVRVELCGEVKRLDEYVISHLIGLKRGM